MSIIRRKDPHYKQWKKRNDFKKMKNKLRSKLCAKKNRIAGNSHSHNNIRINKHFIPYKIFNVPEIFSIIENPNDTIAFLNDIIEVVKKILNGDNKTQRILEIKMDNTKKITVDALMYLLTIIKHTKTNKKQPIGWKGNFPKDNESLTLLKESGYLNYMHTASSNLIKTNECIQIRSGKGYVYQDKENNQHDIRQEVLDFSGEKLNKDKTKINFLMTMLTEMITNIQDHAYDIENMFEHNWYIFVNNQKDKVLYTFMDNGLGIPTTVKKNFFEKMKEQLNWEDEYKYIQACVEDISNRSRTGQIERGNGLPSIYEQYTTDKIDDFIIISNKAYFKKENMKDLDNSLQGTIYYWEIKKGENNYEN